MQIIRNYNLDTPWFNKLTEIPNINSDIPEIKWCEVSQANEFKFAVCLEQSLGYDWRGAWSMSGGEFVIYL